MTPQGSSPPPPPTTNNSVLFRTQRKWRQHAAPASSVDGRKRVRLLLTRTRARRRRSPSPKVTSAACPLQQQCKKLSTRTETVQVGVEQVAVIVEPWIVPIPMVGTPLWRDGLATDVVDPLWIVKRLPQPFDPPASPVNALLEKELRVLFDQMSRSGDVVYRIRAGSAPGLEHIECCDVLTEWTLQLLKKWAGDEVWRVRIERLVYKVLFEYIMKLHFNGGCDGSDRTGGPKDVGELMEVHGRKPEEEPLMAMLVWLKEMAKDPCELVMSGMAQEWHSWRNVKLNNQSSPVQYCTNSLNLNEPPCEVRCQDNGMFLWKMVIRVREALFMKVKGVLPIGDFPYWTSKKQKVHHYLCETSRTTATISSDSVVSSLICQRKIADGSASSSGVLKQPQRRSPRALTLLKFGDFQRKRVPIGPAFQADIPEWKSPGCKTLVSGGHEGSNDSVRSGIKVWPMAGDFQDGGLETTGKGRLDFCVCPSPRSVSCVRYHISKSRLRLKWTLCQAFDSLGFNDMGEEVSNSWTLDEQRIFDVLVKLNPLSENKSFWEPALKLLGSKTRQDIVSYYFNVCVLRRMGIQTRLIGGDADSDDDEFNLDAYEDLYPRVLHKRVIRKKP